MLTNKELESKIVALEAKVEGLTVDGSIRELHDLSGKLSQIEIRLGDLEKKLGEADVSLGLGKLAELKGRLDSLESKADALIAAHQVQLPKVIKKEPWKIERYPLEWRALGVVWATPNQKAEEFTIFNGVQVDLVKGVPAEMPKNIFDDLKRKGWC